MKNLTLEKFFYDNRKGFDTLVWLDKEYKKKFYQKQKKETEKEQYLLSRYIDFKNEFYKEQSKKIREYHSCICKKTRVESGKDTEIKKWWLHDKDRVLGIYWGKEGKHRIGIECSFKNETFDKPLGELRISVASWTEPHFGDYEDAIRMAFPNRFIDYTSTKNRAFLLIAALTPEDNQCVIVSVLENAYNKLKKILDDHQ